MYWAYSRARTSLAPYLTRSAKHLMDIEMRIRDLDSGVEMWKVTLSKSEMTWSMETGVGLLREVSFGSEPGKRASEVVVWSLV